MIEQNKSSPEQQKTTGENKNEAIKRNKKGGGILIAIGFIFLIIAFMFLKFSAYKVNDLALFILSVCTIIVGILLCFINDVAILDKRVRCIIDCLIIPVLFIPTNYIHQCILNFFSATPSKIEQNFLSDVLTYILLVISALITSLLYTYIFKDKNKPQKSN
ncbi:hypothetical protein [Rodentibacter haemolyticus]|uniref:Uncharacterized protein n=1 Tax=Rodentibacter haemolyticus TaxID=2778911 RepID=A0ABX6UZ37_9PAST|nr:hypothetical protein [Rodentibacter haemolyticus]QPB43329.1 hypothetical protein IHV77_04360 [Rodentibacter haemolyticus]